MALSNSFSKRDRSMESMSDSQRPTVTKSNLTMRKSKNNPTNSRVLKESLYKSTRSLNNQLPNDDGYIMKGTYDVLNHTARGSRSSSILAAHRSTEASDVDPAKEYMLFGDPIMMNNGKIGYFDNHYNTHQENHHNYASNFRQGTEPIDFYYHPDLQCYMNHPYVPPPVIYNPYLASNNDSCVVLTSGDRINIIHVNMGDPLGYEYWSYADYGEENCYQMSSSGVSYDQFEAYSSTQNQFMYLNKYEDGSTQTGGISDSMEVTDEITPFMTEFDKQSDAVDHNAEENNLSPPQSVDSTVSFNEELADQASCSVPED